MGEFLQRLQQSAPADTLPPFQRRLRENADEAPVDPVLSRPDLPGQPTNDTINAFTGGAVRDVPIVGPALDEGSKAAAAGIRSVISGAPYAEERKAVDEYAARTKEENPGTALAGGIAGNTIAMAPLGMTTAGARLLGITGPSAIARVATGTATGAAVGGADAAARGEDATAGALVGAATQGAVPGLASILGRIVQPFRTPAARQPLVQVLEKEGVPMTAGDVTGSKPLRFAESELGNMPMSGGKIAEIADVQGQKYTEAALKRAGINAPLATPDVIRQRFRDLGQQYETLSANNTIRYDRQMANDLGGVLNKYGRVLDSQQKQIVNNVLDDVVAQNGQMPGAVYQQTREILNDEIKSRGGDATGRALKGIRDALDSAMGRSVSPAVKDLWEQTNRQYAALKTIEDAMGGAGERTRMGYLSPMQLRAAAAGRNKRNYDLEQLAQAGEGVLKPPPDSGTASRQYVRNLVSGHLAGAIVGGAGGGYEGGDVTSGALGAAAGFFTPGLLARALLSRPAQAYLRNQTSGPTVERAAALLSQGPAREIAVQQYPNATQ